MGTVRFSASLDHGTQITPSTDGFPTFKGSDDRKFHFDDFFAALGVASAAVASLGSASPSGKFKFATDGRKVGETAGNGTGVLVQSNGTNWIAVDSGSAVTS